MSSYLPMVWFLLGIFGFLIYLFKGGNEIVVSCLVIMGIIIVAALVRQQSVRKKRDFYIDKSGGAEDGFIVYHEGEKSLKVYFDRAQDTIYVPSDAKWKEIMPEWAKERKHEIVDRIKKQIGARLIGKSWRYEETDREEAVLPQS